MGKWSPAHHFALELASKSGADLVLIQEPCINTDLSRKLTKNHPEYNSFSPFPIWTSRPRVMTYTRKGRGLSPFQPSIHSRDLLRVCVSRRGKRTIDCWNIHNAPVGAAGAGDGLQLLLNLSDIPDVLAGDFNIHHSAWDPAAYNENSEGDSLLE